MQGTSNDIKLHLIPEKYILFDVKNYALRENYIIEFFFSDMTWNTPHFYRYKQWAATHRFYFDETECVESFKRLYK